MKTIRTVTSRSVMRPALKLPVETYSKKRIREFDAAEVELSKLLRPKKKPAR